MLTALLQFFISYTMAMLAFWMLEISTFIFILFAFEYIASGHLFPLDLLGAKYPALQHALFFTPFPSMLSTPIGIYMGKIAGAGIWLGLLMQLLWLLLAYRLARFAWRAASGNTRRLADEETRAEIQNRMAEDVLAVYEHLLS